MSVKDRADKGDKSTIFEFSIPDDELNRILSRVADFPWHEMPDDGGWDYGANLDYMKEPICESVFSLKKEPALGPVTNAGIPTVTASIEAILF